MAVSKSTIYNTTSISKPEPLPEIPHPECPHPEPLPKIELWDCFDEAIAACERIHLHAGETHTEFYKLPTEDAIHCVVAIGNFNPNKAHLYLSDTGSEKSITDQFSSLEASVKAAIKQMSAAEAETKEALEDMEERLQHAESTVSSLSSIVGTLKTYTEKNISALNVAYNNLKDEVAANDKEIASLLNENVTNKKNIKNLQSDTLNLSTNLNTLTTKVNSVSKMNDIQNASIATITASIKTINTSIATEATEIANIKKEQSVQNTSIAAINSEIASINSEIGNISEQQSALDASLEDHEARIKFLEGVAGKTEIDALKKDIADVSSRLADNEAEDEKQVARLDQRIDDLSSALNTKIDTNVETINQTISNLDASVHTRFEIVDASIVALVSELNKHDERITSNTEAIAELDASVSAHIATIDLDLNNIWNKFGEVDNTIADLSTHVSSIDVHQDEQDALISKLQVESSTNAANIADISSLLLQHIDESNVKFAQLDASVEDINSSIAEVKEHIEGIDNSINIIEAEQIEQNKNIADISSYAIEVSTRLDEHIADASVKFAEVDASLNEIRELATTSIITDASVDSLFSDDIYTVNLCCVTRGGHIEVTDEIEPIGKYKTYVLDDSVSFTAVPNTGFRFKYWLKDADIEEPVAEYPVHVINTSFNSNTIDSESLGINVIGTLCDGIERDPLMNGYTAVFGKLYKMDKHIVVLNSNVAELTGDDVSLQGIWDASDNYADKGTDVTAVAMPIEHHVFNYFMVDGSTMHSVDSSYLFEDIQDDHEIYAYFTELRYEFTTDSRHVEYGNTTNTPSRKRGKDGKFLEGTTVHCVANPSTDCEFKYWKFEGREEVYSTNVSLDITVDASTYGTLIAYFQPNRTIDIADASIAEGETLTYTINGEEKTIAEVNTMLADSSVDLTLEIEASEDNVELEFEKWVDDETGDEYTSNPITITYKKIEE